MRKVEVSKNLQRNRVDSINMYIYLNLYYKNAVEVSKYLDGNMLIYFHVVYC